MTDNRGNGSALNKLMSTKYPASAIMVEMASFMKKKGIRATVEWAPREGNCEAGSLANGNHEGVPDELTMHVRPSQLQWILLQQAPEHGRQAEEVFKNAKEKGVLPKRNVRGEKRRREDRLRFRDPW